MRGEGVKKVCIYPRSEYQKTVHAGGGVKKWQNSVHVVVECPLSKSGKQSHETT